MESATPAPGQDLPQFTLTSDHSSSSSSPATRPAAPLPVLYSHPHTVPPASPRPISQGEACEAWGGPVPPKGAPASAPGGCLASEMAESAAAPAPCPQPPPGTRCSVAMATRMALKEDEGEREHERGSEGESQVDRRRAGRRRQEGPRIPATAAAAPAHEGRSCFKTDGCGPPPLSATPGPGCPSQHSALLCTGPGWAGVRGGEGAETRPAPGPSPACGWPSLSGPASVGLCLSTARMAAPGNQS